MTTTQTLKSPLIAALLIAGSAHAADSAIHVAMEDGKTVAQFKLESLNCHPP